MKNDLIKLLLTGLTIFTLHNTILARRVSGDNDGYEIKVKLTDYTSDTLYLGYQMGGQTYLSDTAFLDKKSGFFTFKKERENNIKNMFFIHIMFVLERNTQDLSNEPLLGRISNHTNVQIGCLEKNGE